MSRSLLLIGGTEKTREEKAQSFFKKQLPHPDFLVIEPELSIGIKEIRDLEHQISLKPYSEKEKVILIKNAEKLTIEAQNAFLKTLEEPPDHSIIILSVLTPDSLIPTIISRCEVIRIDSKESVKIGETSTQNISDFLGVLKLSIGDMFEYCAKNLSNRENSLTWINSFIRSLHNNLIYQNTTFLDKDFIFIQKALNKAKMEINANVAPRFVMENFFMTVKRFLS